jgi:hypothetical protein
MRLFPLSSKFRQSHFSLFAPVYAARFRRNSFLTLHIFRLTLNFKSQVNCFEVVKESCGCHGDAIATAKCGDVINKE